MSFWKKNKNIHNHSFHTFRTSLLSFRKLSCESLETRNLLSCSPVGSVEPFCGPLLPPPDILHGYVSRLEVRSETIAIPELVKAPKSIETVPEVSPTMGPARVYFSTPLSLYSSSSIADEDLVQSSFQDTCDDSDGVRIVDRTELETLTPAFYVDGIAYYSFSDVLAQGGFGTRRVVFSDAASDDDSSSDDAVVIPYDADDSSDDDLPQRSGGGDPEVWNLSMTIDSQHADSGLSTEVRPNAMIERMGLTIGANDPLAGANYLTITVPALPYEYVSKVTFDGSATLGTDYAVYSSLFNVISFGLDGSLEYSGGPLSLYVIPLNDAIVEDSESVTATLGVPYVPGSGGPATPYTFTYGTTVVNGTIIDDDHWKIILEATDSVASERLPGVAQDYGEYSFTRVYSDDSVPEMLTGDQSYGIALTFDVYERPSSSFYCAKPGVDYTLSTTPLSENDASDYLDNFQYLNYSVEGQSPDQDYIYHYSGYIPIETDSAVLRLEPSFDWIDEGELFFTDEFFGCGTFSGNLPDDPGDQTGELVKMSLKTATWTGMGNWNAVGSPDVAEVEIRDGAILEEYLDYDGDKILDVDESVEDKLCLVPHNEDDDNENNVEDVLEGVGSNVPSGYAGVNGEDDLRRAMLYAWVADLSCEDGREYRFDVYQNFPTGDTTAIRLWNEDNKETLYQATSQNPERRFIGSLYQNANEAFSEFWMEGIAESINLLSANAYCYLEDENDVFTEIPALDGYDGVCVSDPVLGTVDLDTDSDNNGYINNVHADDEEFIESRVGKRITYIPNAQGVPDDYIYTALRLKVTCPDTTDVYVSFHYTENLEVYEKTSSGQYVLIPKNTKVPYGSNVPTTVTFEERYYVKAVGANSNTGFASGLDKVHFVLWKRDSQDAPPTHEIARDTVCFSVQDGTKRPEWIVPNGWEISADGDLTTPTPYDGAVGPKDEGSGVDSNGGDAYYKLSDDQLQAGFTISFDFSFVRNTSLTDMTGEYPFGYLQPDSGASGAGKGDEIINNLDYRKMSFFGNSGIKIGNREVQIFDSRSFYDAFSIDVNSFAGSYIKPQFDNTNNYYEDGGLFYNFLSGSCYGQMGSPTSPLDEFSGMLNLLNESGTQHMEIELKPKTVNSAIVYDVSVFLNDVGVFEDVWDHVSVSIPSDQPRIYIQSHWGSGVRIMNVDVTQVQQNQQ